MEALIIIGCIGFFCMAIAGIVACRMNEKDLWRRQDYMEKINRKF